jgi:MoxR-like ATPase
VFYHIEFPDKSKLLEIARKRLTIDDPAYDKAIENAIDRFNEIRQKAMNKKPSTSEFLDWINLLKANNLLNTGTYSTGTGNPLMDASMGVLIKNFDDQKILNT